MLLSRDSQSFIWGHSLVHSRLIRPLKPGEWPANSPDLNIIENLMAHVKREVEVRLAKLPKDAKRTDALYKQFLVEEWNAVPRTMLQTLYNSLPKRCAECLARKGAPLDN